MGGSIILTIESTPTRRANKPSPNLKYEIMKLETFIDKLLSVGFIQNEKGATNWYENYANDTSIYVGIIASEIDCLGHIPIEVIYMKGDDGVEVEKEYLTTTGAWNAIKKLV